MTSEQIRNILKALPNGTTAYKEIKIYLKGRLPTISYEATRLQMNLKENDLIYLHREPSPESLERSYTQFIDVNEIQSIEFIK